MLPEPANMSRRRVILVARTVGDASIEGRCAMLACQQSGAIRPSLLQSIFGSVVTKRARTVQLQKSIGFERFG
ncbi:unnamed protein product [Protopolystoma xenopodis]|uniref:Uncharacterized protein n=1 Tax=Protopolystoma xenopodis TaxID=117903 RepID=A0A3S5CKU4_9PLAT|nr:unnamed protein product [Protopolystoma xenopodis]